MINSIINRCNLFFTKNINIKNNVQIIEKKFNAFVFSTWINVFIYFIVLLTFMDVRFYNLINSNIIILLQLISISLVIFTRKEFIVPILRKRMLLICLIPFIVVINKGTAGNLIVFLITIVYILLFPKVTYNELQSKSLISLSIVYFSYWSIQAITGYYNFFMLNRKKIPLLNPNAISTIILGSSLIIFKYLVHKNNKILVNLFIGISVLVLFLLQSRGNLLALLLFYTTYFLSKVKAKKPLVRLIQIIILLPWLLSIGVVLLASITNVDPEAMKNFLFSKSIFSGREVIWTNFYTALIESPVKLLIGFGSNFSHADPLRPSLSLHSSYLSMLNNFGIIGLALFYSAIHPLFKKVLNFKNELEIGFLVIIPYLVISVFEIHVMSSLFQLVLLVGLSKLNYKGEKI